MDEVVLVAAGQQSCAKFLATLGWHRQMNKSAELNQNWILSLNSRELTTQSSNEGKLFALPKHPRHQNA